MCRLWAEEVIPISPFTRLPLFHAALKEFDELKTDYATICEKVVKQSSQPVVCACQHVYECSLRPTLAHVLRNNRAQCMHVPGQGQAGHEIEIAWECMGPGMLSSFRGDIEEWWSRSKRLLCPSLFALLSAVCYAASTSAA